MQHRKIEFSAYEEVIAEIERLEKSGYDRVGQWNLGQVCHHLDYYFTGSLDGFKQMLPWIIRVLLGKPMYWWLVRYGTRPGSKTAPQSVPPETTEEKTAIAGAKESLRRLATARTVHPSALFGELSVEQWRALHLGHAAHHLGFLIPKA